jgi:universal stress protein A
MLKYHHVLLATCLTPTTQKVAIKAHKIAQSAGAKLSIVHVMEQTSAAYGGEFAVNINFEYEQALEKNIQQALSNLAEEYQIPDDHQYFEMGSINHAVVDLAEKIHADLIVVGSHSHHGFNRLLGSRANAILHIAKCDVLAVRVHDPED